MTKTGVPSPEAEGVEDGGCSLSWMKAATSATTRDVGPVRPLSAGRVALRPQPRWSQEKTWMPCAASVAKKAL